jgi:hypothetical protein
MSKVLVMGDPHCPAMHPGYLPFCVDLYQKWRCNRAVILGDVADWHSVSSHVKEPECPGPGDEFVQTKADIAKLYAAFPHAEVCRGNHDDRIERLAKTVGISAKLLKSSNELWDTPHWTWDYNFIIDDVYYTHGTGTAGIHPAWCKAGKMLMSVCMGHCLPQDTEILTQRGWVGVAEVLPGEYVATMRQDRTLQWQPVRRKVIDSNARIIETDFMAYTPEHRIIYETQSGHLSERKGAQFRKLGKTGIIRAIDNCAATIHSPDFLRLLVWIAADGSYDRYRVRFHLKKDRKLRRLTDLLRRSNIPFSQILNSDNTWRIDVCSGYVLPHIELLGSEKILPWSLVGISNQESQIILEEYANTDGCYINDSVQISCAKRQTIDVLQAMLSVAGIRATTWQRRDTGVWLLSACHRKVCNIDAAEQSILLPGAQDAFCVSVQNGTIVVRRKGKVFITGNCHSRSSVSWRVNPRQRIFAMDAGCGIDIDAWQFMYGRSMDDKPILSAGVVIDGIPYLEIMPIGPGEKYNKSRFAKKRSSRT